MLKLPSKYPDCLPCGLHQRLHGYLYTKHLGTAIETHVRVSFTLQRFVFTYNEAVFYFIIWSHRHLIARQEMPQVLLPKNEIIDELISHIRGEHSCSACISHLIRQSACEERSILSGGNQYMPNVCALWGLYQPSKWVGGLWRFYFYRNYRI